MPATTDKNNKRVVNAMTVDVEDYFQVSAFEDIIDRSDWDRLPCRVEYNTHRILDLFAENGAFDIPADFKIGVTYRPNKGLALNFDVEQIWYGDVDSIANPVRNVYACPTAGAGGTDLSSCFGGANGGGFGWEDMTIYKIGAQWSSGNDWTWRAGFSHADAPIPDNEVMFNILAPATIEDHLTFGFTRALPSGNEWSMAFLYAFNNKITGPASLTDRMVSGNPFDPTQSIAIDMNQWEIEFAFGWR